jgi:hypothetical protein
VIIADQKIVPIVPIVMYLFSSVSLAARSTTMRVPQRGSFQKVDAVFPLVAVALRAVEFERHQEVQ